MGTIIRLVILAALLIALAVGGLRLYFGGGKPYPELAGQPLVTESGLERVLSHPEPVGNVAVSSTGRVFFSVHPEARAKGPRLYEWRDGRAEPFPAAELQDGMLATPLGLTIDRSDRLWVIDPAMHGLSRPRIMAIDLATNLVVHEHVFPRRVAPRGAFLQDLRVDPSGRMVYIADASIWRKSPALVIYDSLTRRSRRVLEDHPAVRAQDWIIRTPMREMRFLAGFVPLKVGLDGIALDPAGQWLYFGAMSHDTLHRVPVSALLDEELDAAALAERVEDVARKPLSDGLAVGRDGGVYVTSVEHGAVLRIAAGKDPVTIVRSPRIRWADGLTAGPDGWIYLADSALPEVLLKTRGHIREHGPYNIYRFRPPAE